MSQDDGIHLMRRCAQELATRFLVGGGAKYIVKVVDANGVRSVPLEVAAAAEAKMQ